MFHAQRYAVHQFVDALAVGGQIVHHSHGFGVHAQARDVQEHQRDAAHHKAGQASRETQLHEEFHHRLQKKRDDRGDDDGNEEHTPVIQQGHGGAGRQNPYPHLKRALARTYWERTLAYHYNWTDVDFKANSDNRRILALDLGKRRIGLALSDPLGITAQGLPTLQRTNIRRGSGGAGRPG